MHTILSTVHGGEKCWETQWSHLATDRRWLHQSVSPTVKQCTVHSKGTTLNCSTLNSIGTRVNCTLHSRGKTVFTPVYSVQCTELSIGQGRMAELSQQGCWVLGWPGYSWARSSSFGVWSGWSGLVILARSQRLASSVFYHMFDYLCVAHLAFFLCTKNDLFDTVNNIYLFLYSLTLWTIDN